MPDDQRQRMEAQDTGDIRPRPDPTVLTTQSLQREIANAREILQQNIDGNERLTVERFKALGEKLDTVNTTLSAQIAEGTRHRAQMIADTERRMADTFLASEKLATAKQEASAEAINKSEASQKELLGQLSIRVDEVRDAQKEQVGAQRGVSQSWVMLWAVLGSLIGVAGIVLAITRGF